MQELHLQEHFSYDNNRQRVVVQVVYEKGILTIYEDFKWWRNGQNDGARNVNSIKTPT